MVSTLFCSRSRCSKWGVNFCSELAMTQCLGHRWRVSVSTHSLGCRRSRLSPADKPRHISRRNTSYKCVRENRKKTMRSVIFLKSFITAVASSIQVSSKRELAISVINLEIIRWACFLIRFCYQHKNIHLQVCQEKKNIGGSGIFFQH